MYWNHSNQTICSAFTVNDYSLKIVALADVTMETLSAFLRHQGDFKKEYLKDGLAKYDGSAR